MREAERNSLECGSRAPALAVRSLAGALHNCASGAQQSKFIPDNIALTLARCGCHDWVLVVLLRSVSYRDRTCSGSDDQQRGWTLSDNSLWPQAKDMGFELPFFSHAEHGEVIVCRLL